MINRDEIIRDEVPADVAARERLLDACFGPARFAKTCERLREGRRPADGLALVAVAVTEGGGDASGMPATHAGRLVGTVRLWSVAAGPGRPALMLGPIAVAAEAQGRGLGARLMREALARAAARGHGAVLLVGDAPYYARFGFAARSVEGLWLPGPFERERFLGLALRPGAFAGAAGLVQPTGEVLPRPDLAALAAAANEGGGHRRAA